MSIITVKQFLELLRRSQLVEQGTISSTLEDYHNTQHGQLPRDAKKLADFFVQQGLLTVWQRDKLLGKKYEGFFLGKYKLLSHLGTDEMSSVYLAEHVLMQRRDAIKVLPRKSAEDASWLDRFYSKAKATAVMDHPNIVRIYDVEKESPTKYLVMEQVHGEDLQAIVEATGPLDYKRATSCIIQAACGLEYAHVNGMIHGHLKPSKLLLDQSGTFINVCLPCGF